MKIDRDNRRNENGKISIIGHKHSEETKKRISEKRKQWLLEHKEQHVWRRDSKFLSEPCEHLKTYLKEKGINFVEEYEPFKDVNYCVDIAWPDEKIAIEVNGNQHYNKDGSLSKYYQKRHNLFESRGWKIFEIHYTKCYNININDFKDILNLSIYDKNYVGKYFSKKELKEINRKNKIIEKIKNKEIQKQIKQNKIISIKNINKKIKIQKENKERKIIYNLLNNSGIDFTKSGWSTKAYNYLLERNELWNKGILRCIRKYYPEFLKREDVWKRKGSIY
jgi:very-short-patch-repair endonuclease